MKTDIESELNWEPSVDGAHVAVTVHDGVVTLGGHVASYLEKFTAERVAKRVSGVRGVANELRVAHVGAPRSDEDIAIACVAALRANVLVPADRFTVIVDNAIVTLEGTAEWQYQRAAAEDALQHLAGIIGISNNIAIAPRVSSADVKHQIEAALARSAELQARAIVVEVRAGRVTLRGRVTSWAEREQAQRAAWAAPGVMAVDNEIAVAS